MYRRALLIIMAVVLPASAFVGMFPQTAHADGTPSPYLAPAVIDAATKSTERNSLAKCIGGTNPVGGAFKNSNYGVDIKPGDIASGDWFSNMDTANVRQWFDYNNGDVGKGTDCDKVKAGKIISDLSIASGNIQGACLLGVKRQDKKADCVNSGNDKHMYYAGGDKQSVLKAIDSKYAGTQFGKSYSPEQYYVMAMSLILNDKTCKATPLALASTATADQKNQAHTATIAIVSEDGVTTQVLYKFNGNTSTKWSLMNFDGNNGNYYAENCDTLAKRANDNANAYAEWVGANLPGTVGNPGTCEQYASLHVGGDGPVADGKKDLYSKLLTACNDGLANKKTPNYCKKYTATDENAACFYGFGTALASTPAGDSTDTPTDDDKPTCGIEGIGWLVCPAMSFMAKIADESYSFIASYFLTIDPKIISNIHTKAAWDQFRNIANVAFVIALLFIIYSQITSFGISNYGIKRMLPRILVAALLVNLSYYICSAAVDLSNLLGYAIPQFFKAIPIGQPLPDSGGPKPVGWVALIGTLIVGAIGIALAMSVPVLIAALLAILLVALMLVARQALIVLLIVVSPLAFVAYLLPNTEQWFKKWYKMLFTLLMLFPIIGVVFAASSLASNILGAAGAASGEKITQVIALAVSAIPFFVVPGMLKGSLAAAGTLGAKLQGAANKATGSIGARAKDSSYLGAYMGQRKKIKATNRAQSYGKGLKGRISNSGLTGKAGSHLASTGMALASREEAEAVDHEMVAMQKQDGWREDNRLDKARDEFVAAMRAKDATRARAAQKILLSGGNAGISQLQSGYQKLGTDMDTDEYKSMMVGSAGQKVLSDLSSSGIKGKNAALDKMAHTKPVSTDEHGNTVKNTVDSIAKSRSTYAALTDSELAGQSMDNIRRAASNGGLDAVRAQRIQSNDAVWSQLSEDKKAVITQVVEGSARAEEINNPTPAPTLTIPHGGGNPPPPPPPPPPAAIP